MNGFLTLLINISPCLIAFAATFILLMFLPFGKALLGADRGRKFAVGSEVNVGKPTGVGFYFVILVTGLNNIPEDVYEAAALDGADGWKRTQFITLPLLRNVLCTCLVLAITGALKVFDLPWVMFGAGMPENRGWLTGTYMYDQTFNKMNVDYGSTIAVLIVVLGVVLSNIANRVFRPSEDL